MAKASTSDKPTVAVKAEKPAEKAPLDPSAQMAAYLKKTSADHYNLTKTVPPFLISSGSLNLDMEIKGLSGGAHRLLGGPNLGKTPFALSLVDTFLDTVPNSRAVWCKAEGRFSERNKMRARHPLVYSAEEWKDGTIFVFKNSIYEAWIDMMRDLVHNNPTDKRYAFVTDSLNNMILRDDFAKPTDGEARVAGAPKLTTQMFQRMGQALNELGHISIFISQVTADIKLNPYDKTPPRQGSSSGGNSISHNANETLEFLNWYESDLILKNPEERLNRITNPALGHVLKIKIQKSAEEKRFVTVEIPIRYGATTESAIWREREIADQMLIWHLVTKTNPAAEKKDTAKKDEPKKGGSWLYLTPALIAELEQAGLPALPTDKEGAVKVQGLNQLYALLEERKDVSDYLFAKFRALVSGGAS